MSFTSAGIMPTVLIVKLRAEIPNPSVFVSSSTASKTLGFCSGSPMPMKDTDPTFCRCAKYKTWSTISSAVNQRLSPIRPVAQKAHASAQPACELMQRLRCVRKSKLTASIRT